MNQVEIYFPIIQRKVLSPNDFTDTDTDVVAPRLADFEERYNQTAKPFRRKFTTNDLTGLLRKLDRTENPAGPTTASPGNLKPPERRRTYGADHSAATIRRAPRS